MKSTINFDAPLAEFAKLTGIAIGTAVRRLTLDLYSGITKRTPVATGLAQSGWDVSLGSPSGFLPAPGGRSGGGTSAVKGIDGTQQVFITNNLPYIERLEHGWSKQAPAGMVRLTMAEKAAEIDIMVAKMNAGQ